MPILRTNQQVTQAGSGLLVDVLDEAGQLLRGGAYGADRLLVVHADRTEQRDRSQRAVRQAVAGADQRDASQGGVVELLADADVGPAPRDFSI